jgi:excisionase family DNA binding protein
MQQTDKEWLSSAEASEFLGVHPTTLRRWSDAGEVPCFRTPGGHRRFRAADLAAWMESRQTTALASSTDALVQDVIGSTRREMVERRISHEAWYEAFDRDEDRQAMREAGQRLFGLAIQYAGRVTHYEPVMQEGCRIGGYYGQQCATYGLSLVDTMRAFLFFRESLMRATRPGLATRGQYDTEDVRMHRQLRYFLDQVMYACLASYEAAGYRDRSVKAIT